MAVTSESSAVTSFPLRTFNTGPGFIRDAPVKDQQSSKKSATERLTESRSKYVRRGSREELEDQGDENRTEDDTPKVRQLHLSQEETQGHVFRAVPYVQDGGRSAAQRSRAKCPPPVPEKPSPMVWSRKVSRDRTLEIVEASLGHSVRRPSNDAVVSLRGAVGSSDFSTSGSSSAGSRVRRLKEQFLNLGSAESESESSQGRMSPTELQKSSSSSESPLVVKKRGGQEVDFQALDRDTLKLKEVHQRPSHTSYGKPKLPERSNLEAADLTKNPGTASEEDHCPSKDYEMRLKPPQASEGLSDQTRRQMERFKARYATDFAKESSQERRINRITLKPTNQEAERKERSVSVNEPSCKYSSGVVRQRSNSSKEEGPGHTSQVGSKPDSFSRPRAPVKIHPVSDGDDKSAEELKKNGMSQKLSLASQNDGSFRSEMLDPDLSKPMSSDDIRRLGRTKQCNISGKSPERWGDAEETSSSQRLMMEHGVHHPGDRVLAQVSSSVFPSKHHVSDKAFKSVQQPQDTRHEDASMEVIHRRVKSDLYHGNALGTPKEDNNFNHARHHSHDDQLQHAPVYLQSSRKTSAQSVLVKHAKTSPDNLKDFKKKSWAPVNFSQNQNLNDVHKQGAQEGHVSYRRALSPDNSRSQTTAAEHPQTHKRVPQHHTPRKISREDIHEHAKSRVQNFLSGIMSSPGGGEILVPQGTSYNDGNGNHIAAELPGDEPDTAGTHWARPTEVRDDVNYNISSAVVNKYDARVPVSEDVELTAVWDEREPSISKKSSGKVEHRRKYVGPSMERGADELDKRRKFSHNSDTSSSKQDRFHLVLQEAGKSSVEPQRVKKVSLADLLSKDTPQETSEATESNQESISRRQALPKPDRSHGDDSETDSERELRRSKVLRMRKPQKTANQKKEDKSLENLLSRILNPDDELNTLKRGTKTKDYEIPKDKVSRKFSRNTCSSSTGESDSEVFRESVLATKDPLRKRDKAIFHASAPLRKPLLNLNRKENPQPVNQGGTTSPPKSLTSPTRRDFQRHRSKSDLGFSPRCSVSSDRSEVERFFNQMGLNESFLQGPLSPMQYSDEDEVFHEMHEYKHVRDDDDGTFSTENSDNISQGSKVSEEGLRLAKKLPDTTQSIITKNARVIKWLCQIRKARAASIS